MRIRLFLILLLITTAAHADRKQAVERFNQARQQVEKHNLPKAEKLLNDSIQADSAYIPAHQLLGEVKFGMRQYNAAADEYATALKLNATLQTLTPDQIHSVTNNLGVALAYAGNLPKAKETFDDAVKQEPDYPIYHYNLACTYAEMGQLDPALQELQTAWKLRKNLGDNERFPDPRQDSSFKNYLSDPKFQETVQYMVF
jgi:Tfp pilus assembly protein PilF